MLCLATTSAGKSHELSVTIRIPMSKNRTLLESGASVSADVGHPPGEDQ
jgi:hypothetical protein